MGLDDREYLRDEARRYGEGGGFSFGGPAGGSREWALKFLLIANVVLFLVQGATAADPRTMAGGLTNWLMLDKSFLADFQIWRLLTYGFCHGGIGHLIWNLIGLWIFGRHIEGIYGSREFLAFYLTGVVAAGLCHVGLQLIPGTEVGPVVGASGGVLAVVILTALHYPRMQMLLMLIVPIELRYLAVLYVFFDIIGLAGGRDGVAHAAHLGGAAFGFCYYRFQWRLWPLLTGFSSPVASLRRKWRDRSRTRELQVFDPGDDDLRERVDQILDKIHTQGEASLTDEERRTLERASRIFRGR